MFQCVLVIFFFLLRTFSAVEAFSFCKKEGEEGMNSCLEKRSCSVVVNKAFLL